MAAQVADVYLRMRCCCGNERCDGHSRESSSHEGHCGALVQAAADDLSPEHLLTPKRGISMWLGRGHQHIAAQDRVQRANRLSYASVEHPSKMHHRGIYWSSESFLPSAVPVCRTGVALPRKLSEGSSRGLQSCMQSWARHRPRR